MKIELDISSDDALAATLLHLECLCVSQDLPIMVLTRSQPLWQDVITVNMCIYEQCYHTRTNSTIWVSTPDRCSGAGSVVVRLPYDLSKREDIDTLIQRLKGIHRDDNVQDCRYMLVPLTEQQ